MRISDWSSDVCSSDLKALVLDGHVRLGGQTITDPSRKIKPGEAYTVAPPEAIAAEPEAQDIPLDVVFEDAHLIVVDKPAGLVVHPAPGTPERTLVNARSEEHTSELQSLMRISYAVFCWKKKKKTKPP